MAVSLLTLPRLLGSHPETGAKVQANLGMYGPYVVHDQGKVGKDYRSIKPPDDVLTITLDRALELLSQPKAARGSSKTATPLKELGAHPESGEPINVYDGRYGPYVKHGDINASLSKDESVENFTLQRALELLANKEAAGAVNLAASRRSLLRLRRRSRRLQLRRLRRRKPLLRRRQLRRRKPLPKRRRLRQQPRKQLSQVSRIYALYGQKPGFLQ